MDWYTLELALAWTFRLVLTIGMVGFMLATSGCTHQLSLSTDSNGSFKRDPPALSVPSN
jgi:hypothetical protein